MRTGMITTASEESILQSPGTLQAPEAWVADAVERCIELGRRGAPRYARHLRHTHRSRDPVDDMLALAARRIVPLPRRVLRPLPGATLCAAARAFNALDRADRRALGARLAGAAVEQEGLAPAQWQAQGEHLASALARLVEGTLAHEARAACAVMRARAASGKELCPPS
jgi:hypothetical protein